MIICENIEESNLKSMTEEELSDFIKTFKEYMESEKQTKQDMQDKICSLENENKLLHNKIENGNYDETFYERKPSELEDYDEDEYLRAYEEACS